MNPLVYILAFATFCSTLIGGSVAIKFRKALPYFFAFASGSLIAVAFFDLLPESIKLAGSSGVPIRSIMLILVVSYLLYTFIERFVLTHHYHEGEHSHVMGPIGAGSLVVHSFLDGAAIGAAFQVGLGAGIIVAIAVISHDFTDGINTVTLMLKNKNKVKYAKLFLIMDAIAPVLGVVVTSAFIIPENVLALLLAFFVGEFLYIGASNLLPELRKHKSFWISIALLAGAAVIFVITGII